MSNRKIKNKTKAKNEAKAKAKADTNANAIEYSAKRALAAAGPRKDTHEDMLAVLKQIWPTWQAGFQWSEEKAVELGLDKKGYYLATGAGGPAIIGPEQAYNLFLYHNYKGNRNFSQRRANDLAKCMDLSTNLSIAIGPDHYPDVINGQHTLWAINMRGRPMQCEISVYLVRNEQAKARLFGIFDTPQKRSLPNTIDAAKNAGLLPDNISSNHLARWSRAVACAKSGFKPVHESLEEKQALVEDAQSLEFSVWMETFVKDNFTRKLAKKGVVAALFATFISDKTKATEFAASYFKGTGLDDGNPILKLRENMINRAKAEHSASAFHEHAGIVYSAWRKFCLGEQMLYMRRTKSLPDYDRWKIFPPAMLPREELTICDEPMDEKSKELVIG